MKAFICDYPQSVLIDLGLDAIDAIIIQWFSEFSSMSSTKKCKDRDGNEYVRLTYSDFIKGLPSLPNISKIDLGRRIKKYIDIGLMDYHFHRKKYPSFKLTGLFWSFISDTEPPEQQRYGRPA